MIIDNVKIYTEAGTFVSGGIITQGDKITEIYTEAEKENIFKKMNMETEHTAAQCSVQDYSAKNDIDNVLDGKGAYAIPGLIDLHFHGCVGDDFCDGDKEAIRRIAEYEVSVGVTAIAPATMTLPVAELENILKTVAAYKKEYEENFKLQNDPRVTKVGRFIRKTSLDEFPQLINILKGEMTLVGPRPIVTDEFVFYGDIINQ